MASIKAVIFDYYETLGQLRFAARERLFDDIARNVGFDAKPGDAYKEWNDKTMSDLELR